MASEELPEPDCLPGAPHPRDTADLFGHAEAQAAFLDAFTGGRLHHAWLLCGPKGVGKATFAWKIARFLLSQPTDDGGMFAPPPPRDLSTPAAHPVSARLRALSEPRLLLLRRTPNDKATALSAVITVDDLRALKRFLQLSSADGGRRVVIIDSADDMNGNAANALLKVLEEPPSGVVFLLVSHRPARLLPTIRSRCRVLRLAALPPDPLAAALSQAGQPVAPQAAQALAELSQGSVGEAMRLTALGGLDLYATLVRLLGGLPQLDRARVLALADAVTAKSAPAGPEGFDLALGLIDQLLTRAARAGATGTLPPEAAPAEQALLRRMAPDALSARRWADLALTLSARARAAKAVNLDPAALLVDILLKLEDMGQPA